MRWACRTLICGVLALTLPAQAFADDSSGSGDLARQQLARVIAVLRLQPDAASQSCLDALRDVHTTEDQIKALQSRVKDPDGALAQDVLETDMENGNEICGADASRICAVAAANQAVSEACSGLHRQQRAP